MPRTPHSLPLDLEIFTLGEFQRAFIDYAKQPNCIIHAAVSSCLLLEVFHKNADGVKSCSSITHIPKSFILVGQERLNEVVKESIASFTKFSQVAPGQIEFRIFGGFNEGEAETLDSKSLKSLLCDTIASITGKIPSAPKGHDCSKSENEVIEYFFSSLRLAYFKEKASKPEEAPICSVPLFGKNPEIVDAFIDHYRADLESPMNRHNRSQADIKNKECISQIVGRKISLRIDLKDRVVDPGMMGCKLPEIEDYNPHHLLLKKPSTEPGSAELLVDDSKPVIGR